MYLHGEVGDEGGLWQERAEGSVGWRWQRVVKFAGNGRHGVPADHDALDVVTRDLQTVQTVGRRRYL